MIGKKVILLCGISYSGKSSWILSFLEKHPDFVVLSSDSLVFELANREKISYGEAFKKLIKNGQLNKLFVAKALEVAKSGQNCIIDQTNLTAKTRIRKLRWFNNYKEKEAVWFEVPSKNEIEKRRNGRKSHKICDSTLQNQIEQFSIPTLEEGFTKISKYQNV